MVTVNGQPREIDDGATVATLVASVLGAQAGGADAERADAARGGTGSAGTGGGDASRGVAVALNGEVVPRASWDGTPVTAGDRVEVLTASQGG